MDYEPLINMALAKHSPMPFIAGVSPVPVSGKVFGREEVIRMIEAVLDCHWTDGRFANEFERRLAEFVGVRFCAAVNSGSSANLLALSALTSQRIPEERRLKRGDEVVTVAAGFPTTVNPIIQAGCVPVFVDVEMGTYNASVEAIAKAISPKTRAVFLAHTLGNPFDAKAIRALCDGHHLWLIEDNCDALGSKLDTRHTGSFGHLSTCSFYPAHHITMGEGGAVLTNDPLLDRIVRSLRDWGRDCTCPTGADNLCGNRFGQQCGDLPSGYDHKYVYSEIGYNLKTTDIQAALGLAQLDRLPGFIQRRQANFNHLYRMFWEEFSGWFVLPDWNGFHSDPSWFGFPLTVRQGAGFRRDDLLKFLNDRKIGTRLVFAGNITKQPYFKAHAFEHRIVGDLRNTDVVMNDTFWIGVYPGLTREMIGYVIQSFREFLGR